MTPDEFICATINVFATHVLQITAVQLGRQRKNVRRLICRVTGASQRTHVANSCSAAGSRSAASSALGAGVSSAASGSAADATQVSIAVGRCSGLTSPYKS